MYICICKKIFQVFPSFKVCMVNPGVSIPYEDFKCIHCDPFRNSIYRRDHELIANSDTVKFTVPSGLSVFRVSSQ